MEGGNQIEEACKDMILSDEQIREVMKRLLKAINEGLAKETHDKAAVKSFATYVQDLPSGKERGKFLAIDLGGTNCRVLLITLDHNDFDMQLKIYTIPQEIMTGPGTQLFDYIAECLSNFVQSQGLQGTEKLPLGFTFSFPVRQDGLTKGILESWTKGFSCSDVVGKDVVALLEEALERRKDVQIKICAILNDTTGTLMSCAWKNNNTRIGLIVGTGCNACYVEKTENVEVFDGDRSKPYVIINAGWGNFGADGALDIILTEYDQEVDENSINRGKQIFEKAISGMYLGEIVRLMLVKFTKLNYIFGGCISEKLCQPGSFLTKYVSEIESNERDDHAKCKEVLRELDMDHATDEDCVNVHYVCQVVSRRAAHLVSAGVATLIKKMGFNPVTVAVDGAVYKYHPNFHDLMVEKIGQIVGPEYKFDILLSEDGSGRGAAFVAAVTCSQL